MKKSKLVVLLSLLMAILLVLPTACTPQEKENVGDSTTTVEENKEEVTEVENKEEPKEEEKEEKKEEAEGEKEEADANSAATADFALKTLVLKGPSSMGLAPIMQEESKLEYEEADLVFTLTDQPADVPQAIIEGKAYVAAIPSNMAAIVNQKMEGGLSVLAINTVGNLHLYSRDAEISKVEDLKDKTIVLSGKGGTPEYVLREILAQAGLDADKDLTLEFKTTHAESVAAIEKDEKAVALLPQPFATIALAKIENLAKIVDLNEVWQEQHGKDSEIITGVVVIRDDVLELVEDKVKEFLTRYEASIKEVNENPADAAKIIEELDILKADVAEEAIPECGIKFIAGKEMQEKLTAFYEILKAQNPEIIGGEVPAEDFYYLP